MITALHRDRRFQRSGPPGTAVARATDYVITHERRKVLWRRFFRWLWRKMNG
jgi:hypothetical protein